MTHTCQYLGPEYDPRTWHETHPGEPTPFCGAPVLEGKSYCEHHYHVVYNKGTALRKRHKDLRKKAAMEELRQMIYDIAEELEDECLAESLSVEKELV